MKKILTKQDIIDMGNPPSILVPPNTVVTPLAKTHAQARAIHITPAEGLTGPTPAPPGYTGGDPALAGDRSSHPAVNSGLIKETVVEEVLRAIALSRVQQAPGAGGGTAPSTPAEHLLSLATAQIQAQANPLAPLPAVGGTDTYCTQTQSGARPPRGVVSVTGANAPGVAALFCQVMADSGVDIVDISQTIVSGFYTMLFVVDISGLEARGLSLLQFRERLQAVAESVGAQAWVMHENVLKAMHRL